MDVKTQEKKNSNRVTCLKQNGGGVIYLGKLIV